MASAAVSRQDAVMSDGQLTSLSLTTVAKLVAGAVAWRRVLSRNSSSMIALHNTFDRIREW